MTVAAMQALLRPPGLADDLVGLPLAAARQRPANGGPAMASEPTGFGLAAMRERAELLGGKLELSSSPQRGTTVRLTVPLSPPPAEPVSLGALGPVSLSPGGMLPPPGRPAPRPPGPRPGRPGSRAHPRR